MLRENLAIQPHHIVLEHHLRPRLELLAGMHQRVPFSAPERPDQQTLDDATARTPPSKQPRRKHLRVVHDEQIARAQVILHLRERGRVLGAATCPMQHQKTRASPDLRRILRDQCFRQFEVEVGNGHRHQNRIRPTATTIHATITKGATATPTSNVTIATTNNQSPNVAGRGSETWRSSNARLAVLAFQATSKRSPTSGTAPTSASIATLRIIRSSTSRGMPNSRACHRMLTVKRGDTSSPTPGMRPSIGSSPIRNDVPGTATAESSSRAALRSASRRCDRPGLGARDSGLWTRDSGLEARDGGLGTRLLDPDMGSAATVRIRHAFFSSAGLTSMKPPCSEPQVP